MPGHTLIVRRIIKRDAFPLVLMFLVLCSAQRTQPQQAPAVRTKVACIGNSITYGDGIQDRDRNSYPAQLQRMLGPAWDVRNFGVSGRTLLTKGDYPYRQTKEFNDAKAFLPDVVVIKLGTNDTKPQNWIYRDEFGQDYLGFIDEFRSLPSHPRIFLCYPVPAYEVRWGIRDSIIRNELIPLIDTIAARRNLPIIDLYSKLAGKPELFPDGIHPDAGGAGLMARAICSRICPACSSKLAPEPIGPTPSGRQLGWESLEYCAFIHFNMNTFTDREWGDGTEDPGLFNPAQLDCRQWVRVCKAAGMKGVIITAKHHDGFCLWPSHYTEHSVKHSPFRGGKGDVLKELSDACREAGLKFGMYLSPWDRHEQSYGDSPRYNEFYEHQLREVLTSYGDVFEVWFDGACGEGPNGKNQVYDWPGFIRVVRECQPGAAIFSDAGPDIRWVGDEDGYAGETNWSLLRTAHLYPGYPGYRELISGHADGTSWIPAECDVSIRPGWFYHPSQDDSVKSLRDLDAIYFASVGRNASLLLNVPVDRRGLIPDTDARRLADLKKHLDETFSRNLLLGGIASGSDVRGEDSAFSAQNAIDDNENSYWATDDTVRTATLTVNLARPVRFNCILLQEFIPLGQRVEAFSVEVPAENSWRTIATGTTIGHKRLLKVGTVQAQSLRLIILKSRACPAISSFGLFNEPALDDGSAQK